MKKHLKWMIPLFVVIVIAAGFLFYTGSYYHAEPEAGAALESDNVVSVTQTEFGWFFDGTSEENVLVFYPGAKVEESAYAPLMHLLAEQGMDVFLVKMPFRLAIFGSNKMDGISQVNDYKNRYIGGHSLGGAMAADYAAGHDEQLDGVILLAAYPTKALAGHLNVLSIYGSDDQVLNREKLADGKQYVQGSYNEYVIEGGNHAQFGNYGEQKGDGKALVTADEQQSATVDIILRNMN